MKYCPDCKKELPIDSFHKNKSRPLGVNNICKSCSSIRGKKYHKKNKEAQNNRSLEYYYKHKEAMLSCAKIWREKNIESQQEKGRNRYHKNKERYIKTMKDWRVKNKEKLKSNITLLCDSYLINSLGLTKETATPELIELMKKRIEISRLMKTLNHEIKKLKGL